MQGDARDIVADATSVYWIRVATQPDGGEADEVAECAKAGCNGVPTVLAVDRSVEGLAVDASSVYWTNGYGTIRKVGLAGGTPTTIASGQDGATKIAVDATNVYWNDQLPLRGPRDHTFHESPSPGAVMKMPIAGGNPTTLASNVSPFEIAVDAVSVYWAENDSPGRRLPSSAQVMKVPIAGGAPTTLASGQDAPQDLVVDGSYVYWTNIPGPCLAGSCGSSLPDTGTVMRVPVGGGTPSTIASQQPGPSGIAVDATSVYWTNNPGGTVVAAPLGGGASSTLATGQGMPSHILADATGIYWTNETGGGDAAASLWGGSVEKLVR